MILIIKPTDGNVAASDKMFCVDSVFRTNTVYFRHSLNPSFLSHSLAHLELQQRSDGMRFVGRACGLKFRNDEFPLAPRVRFVWHPIWFYFIWSEFESYGNGGWGQRKKKAGVRILNSESGKIEGLWNPSHA